MEQFLFTDDEKKKKLIELTSLFLHNHYCESNTQFFISHMDETFSWIGAAEHEYTAEQKEAIAIMQTFDGKVPRCHIADEHYDVIQPSPDIFICSGTLWISTLPDSGTYLRVHQRITAVFRWYEKGPRCCHIHLSNPYSEMMEGDTGFPEKMSRESRKYFQEQIEVQKKKIEAQHAIIIQIYFEDMSTGLYNRNKFNQVCKLLQEKECARLGIAYFDLNGLKKTNDILGHSAGDELICRTASHFHRFFDKKVYRIGGDEFIIIDDESGQDDFYAQVLSMSQAMQKDDIAISHGISWRSAPCNIHEQIEEADRNMYLAKQRFYAQKENNRRKR